MKSILSALALCLLPLSLMAQWREFDYPNILSFEQGTTPAVEVKNSRLSTTTNHYKHGHKSLCWQWTHKGGIMAINGPVAYEKVKTVNTDNSLYSFSFWVYNPAAIKDSLCVQFLKNGRVCCWFNFGLNFTGWRGAYLAFNRDMQGIPEEGMNQVRFIAPKNTKKGELFFDHVILSSLIDSRHHMADFQVPYVNKNAKGMWEVLFKHMCNEFDVPLPQQVTKRDLKDMETLMKRLDKQLLPSKSKPMEDLAERYNDYHFTPTAGRPVFYESASEVYRYWTEGDTRYWMRDLGIKSTNALLRDLAVAYHLDPIESNRHLAKQMYLRLLRHAMDQGFAAGSSMGTLHHSGYSMRDWYTSAFLMRDVLREEKLLHDVQQAMEWFSGLGEVKTAPTIIGVDIDAFNTNTTPRLLSMLLIDNDAERLRYLQCFKRWLDNGLQYTPGLQGSFKVDGTIYHHCNHYPAYARDGLSGIVPLVFTLRGTVFQPSPEAMEHLKQSLLAMRYYCNLTHWPVSLSGRHPDGQGALNPEHLAMLALCGTPDGSEKVDAEMAGAYLRVIDGQITPKSKQLAKEGYTIPESDPEGNRTFPYSCLDIHRRNGWMVAIKGHSRYIWNTETYIGCNLYGRYLNYGNIHILPTHPNTHNTYGGYAVNGWDWNHFPGTTATVYPIPQLHANILNISDISGYEEMLMSDEAFCNGLSLEDNGIWGMKLHSHDKYDGTLHARKSVFCFDDRIICLGSNICSATQDHETHTTLFQVEVDSTRLAETLLSPMADHYGNYYYPAEGQTLYHTCGLQHSFHEETAEPTQGYFDLLAINHGAAPKNASYHYAIQVQPEQPMTKAQMEASYTILQQDSSAHIVRDEVSGMIGYVLFEPNTVLKNNRPCLVMTKPTDSGLVVSISDPDLHLYEGNKEKYDENGKRKEQIVYATDWKYNMSKPSTVTLTIPGYEPISVTCQHGLTQTITINK